MAIQVLYSEKDIEDVLSDNLESHFNIKCLRRQFVTPVGTIDILARSLTAPSVYYVIEIKKGAIDPYAYAQVHRYARWLNSELSKNGTRKFHPVLVGSDLHESLIYLCEPFDDDNFYGASCIARTSYKLYNFNLKHGISFDYISTKQQDAHSVFQIKHCHINYLEEGIEFLEYQNWRNNNG